MTRTGRIAGVETARGSVRCEAVVVCTGLWSRQVAAMAGVPAPLLPCEHFYLLTKPVLWDMSEFWPAPMSICIHHNKTRKHADHIECI